MVLAHLVTKKLWIKDKPTTHYLVLDLKNSRAIKTEKTAKITVFSEKVVLSPSTEKAHKKLKVLTRLQLKMLKTPDGWF